MPGHISDDIAVVGVAHRLPQDVEDDASFWEVLQGARNLSTSWPEERMNADAHPHPRNGKVSLSVSQGGFLQRPKASVLVQPCISNGEPTACIMVVNAYTNYVTRLVSQPWRAFHSARPSQLRCTSIQSHGQRSRQHGSGATMDVGGGIQGV